MNKTVNMVLIILGSVLLTFASYITVDCIRLRNSPIGTKPLITVGEYSMDSKIGYNGIGYNIEYYVDKEEKVEDMTYIGIYGYGAEFRLFDKIMIWAWVE